MRRHAHACMHAYVQVSSSTMTDNRASQGGVICMDGNIGVSSDEPTTVSVSCPAPDQDPSLNPCYPAGNGGPPNCFDDCFTAAL